MTSPRTLEDTAVSPAVSSADGVPDGWAQAVATLLAKREHGDPDEEDDVPHEEDRERESLDPAHRPLATIPSSPPRTL